MASSARPQNRTRPSSTKALFDDVIVPGAVSAAGEVGAAVDRVAAFSRKSPGPALAASLVAGTVLGWLLGRPKPPPETWAQQGTRRLAEAARSAGFTLSPRQLAALNRAASANWRGRR